MQTATTTVKRGSPMQTRTQGPRGALVLGAIERTARDQRMSCHSDGPDYNNKAGSDGHSKMNGR